MRSAPVRARPPLVALALLAAMLAPCVPRAEPRLDPPLMQQRGQHPLNAVFGLPSVAARAVRDVEWQVAVEQANSFMGGVSGEEILLIDGESTELALRHRRRLGACWQAEAVLPFVAHSGGWANRAIDDWHRFFGLPDGRRGEVPHFELSYVWEDAQGRRRELDDAGAGIGDVQLSLQRGIGCRAGASGAARGDAIARVGIKLPTGDSEALFGSGAADAYADVQSPVWSFGRRWHVGAALGALVTGRSELFAARRPLVFYGALGLELDVRERWSALVQLDWHTPFHDSALRELGATAVTLGVGLRYVAGRRGRFELSIAEDAAVDTTPDIVARLSWTWRPEPALPSPPDPALGATSGAEPGVRIANGR